MSRGRFAEGTAVPVERTKAEIERTLTKYGATHFGTMTAPEKATVYFQVKGRQVQWDIPMPKLGGYDQRKAEAEIRRRWRVMLITIKAMLEAVDSKLLTFDQAFLSHIVIPGTAQTLGQVLTPKLDALYSGQSLPALLSENPQ